MGQTLVEFALPMVTLGGDEPLSEQTLDVPYMRQTASEWCWATSATMVSRFLFQSAIKICQVASTLITDQDCCAAAPAEDGTAPSAGSTFFSTAPCNRTVQVPEVGQLFDKLGIQSTHRGQKIDFETLCDQIITAGSVIEVAFLWDGGGGHVVVVRGVDEQSQVVRINDPWPDTGETLVPFSQLVTAYGKGKWFDCWTDIAKRQGGPPVGTV
jgi:hypothetical protein